MSGQCGYNCSERPDEFQYDADITGTGVLVGYTVSAGLVVIIITVHYFLCYNPALDAFRNDNWTTAPSIPSRQNPVDVMVLKSIRRRSSSLVKPFISDQWNWSRLDSSLMKYVLSMSDIQIATGIAILVSGYAQLPCGLSSFLWLLVVRLAWFSSLTHLSCLTLLRNYLHNRPAQRHWRILSMLVLMVMLVVAMVPTGHYQWAARNGDWVHSSNPSPSDYAICNFSRLPQKNTPETVYMLLFLVPTVLGFSIRVVKLHTPLSIFLVAKPRKIISKHVRDLLWKLHQYGHQESRSLPRAAGNIVYFAALAFFLSIRVLADHWASMFFEVYWLLVNFAYGLSNLIMYLDNLASWDMQSGYSNNWSFGQIMPIVLLAVPFITFLELLYPDETATTSLDENANQSIRVHAQAGNSTASLQHLGPASVLTLDPDQDYYANSSALRGGNLLMFFLEFAIAVVVLLPQSFSISIASFLAETEARVRTGAIFGSLFGVLWMSIILSLLVDWVIARKTVRRSFCVMLKTMHSITIIGMVFAVIWVLL